MSQPRTRADLLKTVVEAVGAPDLERAAEACLLALAHQHGPEAAAEVALRCGLALSKPEAEA